VKPKWPRSASLNSPLAWYAHLPVTAFTGTQPNPTRAQSMAQGCGCKLSPARLAEILKSLPLSHDKNVLVGSDTSDDAAVYRLTPVRTTSPPSTSTHPSPTPPLDARSTHQPEVSGTRRGGRFPSCRTSPW
jgi:hypothetical protein